MTTICLLVSTLLLLIVKDFFRINNIVFATSYSTLRPDNRSIKYINLLICLLLVFIIIICYIFLFGFWRGNKPTHLFLGKGKADQTKYKRLFRHSINDAGSTFSRHSRKFSTAESTSVTIQANNANESTRNKLYWNVGDALDKKILILALPAILNNAILPLVGAADTFWVGRMKNALTLAGQGAANQVTMFMSMFVYMLYLYVCKFKKNTHTHLHFRI